MPGHVVPVPVRGAPHSWEDRTPGTAGVSSVVRGPLRCEKHSALAFLFSSLCLLTVLYETKISLFLGRCCLHSPRQEMGGCFRSGASWEFWRTFWRNWASLSERGYPEGRRAEEGMPEKDSDSGLVIWLGSCGDDSFAPAADSDDPDPRRPAARIHPAGLNHINTYIHFQSHNKSLIWYFIILLSVTSVLCLKRHGQSANGPPGIQHSIQPRCMVCRNKSRRSDLRP